MKLPKNPTEAQILAVTGLVIKSIYTRGTVAVQTLDLDSQGRLTGIFLGDGVRFRYTIDNGILSYAPVNPKDLPSEEGVSLSEDALDFARLKIAGNTKQEKKCKVGYACGYSCISQNKVCNKALPGQAKNGAEWVKMQREKEQEGGRSMQKPRLDSTKRKIKAYQDARARGYKGAEDNLRRLIANGEQQLKQRGLGAKNREDIQHDIDLMRNILKADGFE